jgi:hypothetical protein
VFIFAASIDFQQLCRDDKIGFGTLFFIAYVIPLLISLWLIFGCSSQLCQEQSTKSYVECDKETGICQVKDTVIQQGKNKTFISFN